MNFHGRVMEPTEFDVKGVMVGDDNAHDVRFRHRNDGWTWEVMRPRDPEEDNDDPDYSYRPNLASGHGYPSLRAAMSGCRHWIVVQEKAEVVA